MHEMALMSGVFEAMNTALIGQKVSKVTKVKIAVGKFSNAEPEALEFAFKAFRHDTLAQGAELEIEQIPIVGRCQRCGREFPLNELIFRCPYCCDFGIEIISGRELVLESLEVEE